ncbi:EF-hand domain-containing protein [Marimonas arenosa]|uniref:EF-hand domain-containing protein n=1 Tax=Marimonas arenosa TaxID=1795305 RepID=A0AAE3WGL2_9RHOB|nr:EF-hand domain-containing protein [Marimonas arenosa]MDQ2092249.1 EF-hand domain-containing protein [Marimonas arenosa]
MKRNVVIAGVAALGLVAGAGMVLAHGKKMGGEGMMGGMRGGPVMNFDEIDADKDGKITQAEMQAHAKARFDAADGDGDGKLSAEEMKAAAERRAAEWRAQRAERMVARMLERLDADADGALSFDEMPGQKTHAARMFERADSDGDGAISKAEMDEARARFEEHRGKRHDRHGDGYHGKRWME